MLDIKVIIGFQIYKNPPMLYSFWQLDKNELEMKQK